MSSATPGSASCRPRSSISNEITSRDPRPHHATAESVQSGPSNRAKRLTDTRPSEDRRPSALKQTKRTSLAGPSTPSALPTVRRTGIDRTPPDWYNQLPRPKEGVRGRNQSDAETQLGRLKTSVFKAKSKVQNRASVLGAGFDEILERRHTLAFLRVVGPLLKRLRMLETTSVACLSCSTMYSPEVFVGLGT